jgi:hypothetical protein
MQQFFAVVHGQVKGHAGIFLRKLDQQAREKIVARANHANLERSA